LICYNQLGTKPPTTETCGDDSCYKMIWTYDGVIRRGCGCFTPRGDMPRPRCCKSDKCNL
uniref:Angustatin n=1 Tax=Dendroaspis angusticeps TaxID=8618 RepID=3SPT_DENAN|nr:RecName: Full=Thrombostatin; AltName: Full=Glycoprotein IIb-IIIa antagonist; AltName: Full=Platelet aggregation inhibitor [Dendroaspis angusticeps]